ncbi:hypothetical protein ACFVYP_11045 [Kitasatospora sp. NPDC058201]|uniref:hypothetical protein n=1 Tax=Streptomycetaceae TaxID=2062 RepID=UPI002E75B51A|nr:hypothetical protein [Streptomyces sp. BE303]MED7952217.1 hypothetical protein [Streptomyces sp. BE303]
MRTQHRRSLALAAAATLVSGAALAAAPAASALPRPAKADTVRSAQGQGVPGPGVQEQRSPVTVTLDGFPRGFTAGGLAAEFTATLRNSADHAVDVTTGFTVANGDSGIRETQLRLEFQPPGGAQWKPATPNPGAAVGATWTLDAFNSRLSLPAGGSATYRLRLAVTADAPAGRATAALNAVVSDPTLPPENRISSASSPFSEFVTTAAGGSATPTPAPAPGVPFLALDAVPVSFTAGGEAKPFRLSLTNRSGKEIAFLPELTFRGRALPTAEGTRLEFQTAEGEWLPAVDQGSSAAGRLTLTLRTGDKDSGLVRLRDGESRTVNVRLAFAQDVPAGVLSLVFTGLSLPQGGGNGSGATATSSAVDITVAGAAPSTPQAPQAAPSTVGTAPVAEPTAPSVAPAGPPAATAPAVGLAAVTSPAPSTSAPVVQAADATPTAPAAPAPAVTVTVAAAPLPPADLATTGGDSFNAPMAITGGTAIAMGIGTLLVAHRRQQLRPAARPSRPAAGPAAGPAGPPGPAGPVGRPGPGGPTGG